MLSIKRRAATSSMGKLQTSSDCKQVPLTKKPLSSNVSFSESDQTVSICDAGRHLNRTETRRGRLPEPIRLFPKESAIRMKNGAPTVIIPANAIELTRMEPSNQG